MLLVLLFFFVVLSPFVINAGLNWAEVSLCDVKPETKRKTHATRGPLMQRRRASVP